MELLGNPGRPAIPRPAPDFEEQGEGEPVKTGVAMPSGCVRVLHDPFGRQECRPDCAGYQRDGSCLCDIVRECASAGVTAEFEIDFEGYWVYAGEPIPTP